MYKPLMLLGAVLGFAYVVQRRLIDMTDENPTIVVRPPAAHPALVKGYAPRMESPVLEAILVPHRLVVLSTGETLPIVNLLDFEGDVTEDESNFAVIVFKQGTQLFTIRKDQVILDPIKH